MQQFWQTVMLPHRFSSEKHPNKHKGKGDDHTNTSKSAVTLPDSTLASRHRKEKQLGGFVTTSSFESPKACYYYEKVDHQVKKCSKSRDMANSKPSVVILEGSASGSNDVKTVALVSTLDDSPN